jgi:hypothetical protein
MAYSVGKYSVTVSAFGPSGGTAWSGHWLIFGPNSVGGHDRVDSGMEHGPFETQARALEAARAAGVARAEDLQRKDEEADQG